MPRLERRAIRLARPEPVLALSLLTFPNTLWRWLTGDVPRFAVLWEMDPNGRVIPSRATTGAGVEMDPNG